MAVARIIRRISGWLFLSLGLCWLAAEIGGIWGTNRDWMPPDDGVTIYVETNGFHTGFILPAQAEGIDWHALFPPTDLADRRYHATGATDHVAISWGERDFYLGTPRWEDMRIRPLLRASIGSDATLVHIYHMRRPAEGRYARRLVISHAAYRSLANALIRDVARPDNGPLQPVPGYGGDDVFYEARGYYSLVNSCNSWTGDHLRAIGVRIGAWTPAEHHVMRWFPASEPQGTAARRAAD
ncbi:TIGR02117 family protein [Blastomonas sp.]|uniref:TIGR02117 family protein n=1 Tax=Blastomonas sp. TaxID=1909299 RepID=UPI0035931BC0